MNSDTKYLKQMHLATVVGTASLRVVARMWASSPSGGRFQRAALAWLQRKSPARAAECAKQSREGDALLARKLDAIDEARRQQMEQAT